MSFASLREKLNDCLNEIEQLEQKESVQITQKNESNPSQLRETIDFLRDECKKANVFHDCSFLMSNQHHLKGVKDSPTEQKALAT